MKRFHVHVAVESLADSVRFYSAMFAAEPTVLKPDYAKWMLDDPRVNFAISQRGAAAGIEHLGIQVEDERELAEVHDRLVRAEGPLVAEPGTTCCYATSDKWWIKDPQGVSWESFLTMGDSTVYAGDADGAEQREVCCEPPPAASQRQGTCCVAPSPDKAAAAKQSRCGCAA
ncbi:MAG: ArsI/CadI family heavy metal resistance metalloenzyme [Gemmatimonas sp.]